MTDDKMLYQAGKIADLAGTDAKFRAELVRRLQAMDTLTTYSGEAGDRVAHLSSFLSKSVDHYVVSCGQVMTRKQAIYIGRIKETA